MSAIESVAYLKGLAEGLGIDAETKEGKLFTAIINSLNGIAQEVDELGGSIDDLGDEMDEVIESLENIEEVIFGDDDDDDDDDDDEDDDDDDEDCDCDEDVVYEVNCPSCGEEIVIDEEAIESGGIVCPKCGEKLEFEFDEAGDE